MKTRMLGPLRVSSIGLGLWQLGSPSWGTRNLSNAVDIIREAIEHNINFFDTAEVYGWGKSEKLLGDALKELRVGDDVIIATKIAGFRSTPYFIRKAAQASKRRLSRTPDLIQYHWPPPYHTPLCKALRGLEKLIDEGLTHYIGLSNFDSKLLARSLSCFHKHEPISLQIQYNLAYRAPENILLPMAKEKGLTIIAWSPVAKGALAGARKATTRAQKTDKLFKIASSDKKLQSALRSVAEKYNVTLSQVSLAWLIAKNALPIPGTRRKERIIEYSNAMDLSLTREDIQLLDEASKSYVTRWGRDYNLLQWLRLVPSPIQYLFIRATGGV